MGLKTKKRTWPRGQPHHRFRCGLIKGCCQTGQRCLQGKRIGIGFGVQCLGEYRPLGLRRTQKKRQTFTVALSDQRKPHRESISLSGVKKQKNQNLKIFVVFRQLFKESLGLPVIPKDLKKACNTNYDGNFVYVIHIVHLNVSTLLIITNCENNCFYCLAFLSSASRNVIAFKRCL
ncbi:phage related protein [gamma proteobacterium HdN1]|nr:Hypothetical protein HDN1F_17940 [gamma proteobacterium HdN1]CBL47107.1 phage related protein [gamma proteobacterium HdN1]